MIRDLSHDWHHEREQYIEVAMSEAQWATLVSSLNSTAIPCTLTYLMGKCIDRLQVGAFENRTLANSMLNRLKMAGFKGFITK